MLLQCEQRRVILSNSAGSPPPSSSESRDQREREKWEDYCLFLGVGKLCSETRRERDLSGDKKGNLGKLILGRIKKALEEPGGTLAALPFG